MKARLVKFGEIPAATCATVHFSALNSLGSFWAGQTTQAKIAVSQTING